MRRLALVVQCRHWHRLAAGSGYSLERSGERPEHDDPVRVPCATEAVYPCVKNVLRWTAGGIDPFQLALSEESNASTIRGPEGVEGVFGAGKRLSFHSVQ